MTPFDEWDFDGINEMILADIDVKGKATKALVHFDRNGFAYTMDRVTGALQQIRAVDARRSDLARATRARTSDTQISSFLTAIRGGRRMASL